VRVLVTGLGTYWGSRAARALEAEPGVELIVGVDTREPRLALDKTEFVRTDSSYSILQRIVKATQVDTIVHTHLITDSTEVSGRALHEVNVIGTANLLAAAGAAGSPVRKLVMKSSTHVYGSNFDDPYWFREDTARKRPPRTRVERTLVDADQIVREFAEDDRRVVVTRLRFADALGTELESSFVRILAQPVVPEVLGFDPRLQFVHEDDAVTALVHATTNQVPGAYNVAGHGVMPWSEVCGAVGRRRLALPPLLTAFAAEPLRMLRIASLPREVLRLLRYGRAVDNGRYQREGFRYEHSTASAVDAFAKATRLRSSMGAGTPEYEYERDVEAFFRHSPAVVRD
jgi:UDP-glucose 4-epimerase